jgi:heme o synthase
LKETILSLIDLQSSDVPLIRDSGVKDFFALMKPRVMVLVVFTAIGGLMAAPGAINPVIALIAIFAIAVGGGAAGALNMWYEAEIDGKMKRTANRPIPSGKIGREEALIFGLVLAFFSVLVLTLATNVMAGGLLAFTIFFYAVIYTMLLKPNTAQNIVIGGAAGAFPPMIGWAAVTGSFMAWPAFIMFLIIFLWTPPHFWALALVKNEEYQAAGLPMLPVAGGPVRTRIEIVIYSLLLAPLGVAPTLMGFGGWISLATGIIGGGLMLFWAFDIFRKRDGDAAKKACWRMFGGSINYLFAVFGALMIEHAFDLPMGL